jgi:hypothetical protein
MDPLSLSPKDSRAEVNAANFRFSPKSGLLVQHPRAGSSSIVRIRLFILTSLILLSLLAAQAFSRSTSHRYQDMMRSLDIFSTDDSLSENRDQAIEEDQQRTVQA